MGERSGRGIGRESVGGGRERGREGEGYGGRVQVIKGDDETRRGRGRENGTTGGEGG